MAKSPTAPPRPGRDGKTTRGRGVWLRRLAVIFLILILVPPLLVALVFGGLATDPGRAVLAGAINRFADTDTLTVRVDGIGGHPLTRLTVDEAVIGDGEGDYLTVRNAVFAWDPFALIDRHLAIADLSAGSIHLERLPVGGEREADPSGGPPSLPSARLTLDRLHIDTLSLGEAVAGAPARLTVAGAADIALPAGPGNLDLQVRRIDESPGEVTLTAALDPGPQPGIADDTLTLGLSASEPAGGVLAGLLNLPGRPAIDVSVQGTGPIRAFEAEIAAEATDLASIAGEARIEGAVDADSLTGALDLAVTTGPNLPAPLPDLLGPEPTVSLRVHRTADGDILVERARVESAVANLAAEGRIDPAGDIALDLTIDTRSAPLAALAPGIAWEEARLTAELTGQTQRPQLSAALSAQRIAAPGAVTLGALDLSMEAAAVDGPDGVGGQGQLTLRLGDPSVPSVPPPLLAAPITVTAAGSAFANGALALDTLTVDSARIAAEATASAADFGARDLAATVAVRVPDLAGLAGPVAGGAALDLAVSRIAADEPFTIEATATGEALETGIAAADVLIGADPSLTLSATATPAGEVDIRSASLRAEGLTADASGLVLPGALSVDWRAAVPALSPLSPALSGAIDLDGHLSGPFDALGGDIRIAAGDLTAGGETIRDLTATLAFDQIPASPRIDLTAAGSVRDRPIDIALSAATEADGTLIVEDGRVILPGAALELSARVPAGGAPTATARLAIEDLSLTSAMAGPPVDGRGTLAIDLTAEDGVRLTGDLSGIAVPSAGVSVGGIALSGTGRLPEAETPPQGRLTVRASDIAAGGQRIDRMTVTADGGPSRIDLTLDAGGDMAGEPARLTLATALDLADPQRLLARLTALGLEAGGERLDLTEPATIAVADGTVTVDRLGLAGGLGALTARDIAVGADRLAGQVAITLRPASAAERFAPDLGIGGEFSAEASLAGTPAAPDVDARFTARDLTARPIRDAGLPSIAADGRLSLADGRLASAVDIVAGALADLAVEASLPVPPPGDGGGRLAATVTGTADLAGLNALLAASGDRVSGRVDIDLSVGGTLYAPVASGTVDLVDGAYRNRASGLDLRAISARLEGRDRTLRLTDLSARSPNDGSLSGSGEITLDPDRGLPLSFAITTRQLQAVDRTEATAILSGDLNLTGAVTQGLALVGAIRIDRAELRAPDRLPVSVPTLDVIELNTPADLAERRAPRAEAGGPSAAPPIDLDLTIDAPNRVFLRGFGVDAELAGRLTVGGTAAAPRIGGFLEIIRGTLNFLGQAFTLDEGRLTFNEAVAPDPALSLAAVTPTADGTATLGLEGTLTNPEIVLSASPPLPEDEVLSQILFGESSGELSAFQAVQLAQALAAYAGLTDQVDPVSRARDLIGLDYLDVDTGGEAGPTVEAGQVLTDRVRIGARQSLGGSGPSATVEIEILPELRLESEVGADGDTGLGVIFQRDY